MPINSPRNLIQSQPFSVTYSRIFYRIEIALHVLILVAIIQMIEWPYVLLFLMLFLLLTWRFFNEHSMRHQYSEASQIQWVNNPAGIRWADVDHENYYPAAQLKILMTRWFILLQLGKGRTKVSRLLLADSFDSSRSFSQFRKLMLQAIDYAS